MNTPHDDNAPASGTAASDCPAVLKVLAEATRLEVARLLLDGPKRVGELIATLRIDQSLLSHHLRVMRDAGLVRADRDGKAMRYRLAPGLADRRGGGTIDLGCCALRFSRAYL